MVGKPAGVDHPVMEESVSPRSAFKDRRCANSIEPGGRNRAASQIGTPLFVDWPEDGLHEVDQAGWIDP